MRPSLAALALAVAAATHASASCTTLTAGDALLVVDVQNDFLETRSASNRSATGPHDPAYPIPSSERTGPDGSMIRGGSLAVPGSAIVADRTELWYEAFAAAPGAHIFASQDFHPAGHCSFCRNGTAAGNPQGYHPHGAVCFSGKDVPTDVMNATNRCLDGESKLLWGEDKYVQWPDHCVQGSFGSLFDPFLGIPKKTVVVQKGFEHHYDSYSAFGGVTVGDRTPLADAITAAGIRRLWVLGVALDYCVQQSTLDALGANPGTGRSAPPTLESVVLIHSATAAVNVTAGEKSVQDIIKAGGHVVTAAGVEEAVQQFCNQPGL
ncbi:hypothetical protein FNF27_07030 [Cafeteria roenbergensis]|uniref:nicotinamidase n=2 Tax=Cafeteria roenbergensis TaxID=33653 RepID=A0A5A8CZX1_CAFRO|nr:hypothetical protein FNF31_05776 [Cafeteria roenbergensis]KAA0169211.1 hypothetical protein FNF27_07030 [Cafeteria roenbergensis]